MQENIRIKTVVLFSTTIGETDQELDLSEFQDMLAGSGIGTYVWYIDEDRAVIDAPLADLLGLEGGGQEIPATSILDRVNSSDRLAIEGEVARAVAERAPMKWSFRYTRANGEVIWLATRAAPIFDTDGQCRRIAGINFDVTDETERLIHSSDVAGEMGHRVKNILTVVTGMARLLDDQGVTAAEYKKAILDRLQGLSSTHDLIYRETGPVTVPELARRVVWSIGGAERLQISGPPTLVSDQAAQTLTMALTELSTNAIKHGALRSDVDGKVALSFEVDEADNRFEMIWEEMTEGDLQAPTKSGYGSLVLDRVTASTFSGKPSFDWRATGLTYRCLWPLDQVQRDTGEASPETIER